jgi:hypothetical protein
MQSKPITAAQQLAEADLAIENPIVAGLGYVSSC